MAAPIGTPPTRRSIPEMPTLNKDAKQALYAVAGVAAKTYDQLIRRGESLVTGVRRSRSTRQAADATRTAVSRTKAATTRVRRSATTTRTSAKAAGTTVRRAAKVGDK